MRKKLLTSVILAGLYLPLGTFPQEASRKKVVLSEIVKEVIRINPKIKAAHDKWQAALEKIPQQLALAHGTPSDAAADVVLHYATHGRRAAA